ncbi:MarR family transcriptional regulator [Phytohabitans sp. ZYX-F-186]|uniref:MarR family transcriptional regulator n=1 Tax=Phytohabitans maris TaxID=3071409 RepID=A0ABU0ZLL6_9ACTN|nr:MarR family transcriptional regulator [Phytohabitans sp. ZYX-F-186]MDQ7907284.1 MarR family transcriptional regulator [Phytohabitans sp. ZYX-F-186]
MDTAVASELTRVLAGMRRVVRRRLAASRPPRLPAAQIELLIAVEEEPGIGVAAAARVLHLADNSVSGLVNVLVDAGYLARETDPADRRAARLFLTPAASDRLTGWRVARAELVGRALERLDEADRETVAAALPALRRLLDQMRDEEEPA